MTKIDSKEIRRLHALGFAIHWIKPRSKAPVNSGWTKGPRLSWAELSQSYKPGFNVGVRLGEVSKIGKGYLAVIDLDVKSEDPRHAAEAKAKLLELFPHAKAAPVVASGRGNGSAHYYVLLSSPVSGGDRKAQSREFVKVHMPSAQPSKKEEKELDVWDLECGMRIRPAWEISLLSEGRQVVLPGSIHPDSGKLYTWGSPVVGEIPFLPGEFANSGASNPLPAATPGKKQYRFANVNLESLGLRPDQVAAIATGEGVEDRSAACFSLAMAMLKREVPEEYIISVLTDREFYLGNTGFDHAKTTDRNRAAYWVEKYCLQKAKARVNETAFDSEVVEEGKKNEAGEILADPTGELHAALGFKLEWQKELDLQKGPAGAPPTVKATFKNVRLILENEVSQELLRRNLFANEDFWNSSTPWGYEAGRKRSGNVDDALQVKGWLIDSEYSLEAAVYLIDEVLNFFATNNSFHPVKEFLESIEWDGKPRVADAFRTYLGANMPEPYQSAVSSIFFQALIQRIYEPGCKFDHVPVLEGKQGIGKSTFARYLVSDKWFMDGLPDFQDKDAALNLQGIWICELSELATIYRSANEQAKAFITRQTDKVRPPYGHRRVDFPRSTVFLGTTNARDYLTDPTGNRRFWPIEIERCDFIALAKDREQLLAEAKFLYENFRENLFLTGPSLVQAEEIQESRRVEDESDAMAGKFLEWMELSEDDRQGFDIKDLEMEELFERGPFKNFKINMPNRRAAGTVLRKAGYHKVSGRGGKRWRPV